MRPLGIETAVLVSQNGAKGSSHLPVIAFFIITIRVSEDWNVLWVIGIMAFQTAVSPPLDHHTLKFWYQRLAYEQQYGMQTCILRV